jgi:hypothetical protein
VLASLAARRSYADGQSANVILSFQPYTHTDSDADDFSEVVKGLEKDFFQCTDLSKNMLAKTHARYFGGGRASAPDERLFRFEVSHALCHERSSRARGAANNRCYRAGGRSG